MSALRAGQKLTAEAINSIFGNIEGLTVGMVTITPTPDTATSELVSGLTTPGSLFAAFVTAKTTVPGIVTEVSASGVTDSQLTVNILRSNDTATDVWWLHVGYS